MAVKGILQLQDILEEYAQDVKDGITEAAHDIADDAVKKLNRASPKRTGTYAKKWTASKNSSTYGDGYTIHVKPKQYRLTHLLEEGHRKKNNKGFVNPIIHIKPIEDNAIKEYEKQCENIIKNGGR